MFCIALHAATDAQLTLCALFRSASLVNVSTWLRCNEISTTGITNIINCWFWITFSFSGDRNSYDMLHKKATEIICTFEAVYNIRIWTFFGNYESRQRSWESGAQQSEQIPLFWLAVNSLSLWMWSSLFTADQDCWPVDRQLDTVYAYQIVTKLLLDKHEMPIFPDDQGSAWTLMGRGSQQTLHVTR